MRRNVSHGDVNISLDDTDQSEILLSFSKVIGQTFPAF